MNKNILNTLIDKLTKQYKTLKKINDAYLQLLGKYHMGNKNNGTCFIMPNSICSINAGKKGPNDKSIKLVVKGVKQDDVRIYFICDMIKDNNIVPYNLVLNTIRFNEKSMEWTEVSWSWNSNKIIPFISGMRLYKLSIYIMAYFLYYTNNYDNIIK